MQELVGQFEPAAAPQHAALRTVCSPLAFVVALAAPLASPALADPTELVRSIGERMDNFDITGLRPGHPAAGG